MGRFVFKMPDVGEGTAEAEIVKWHVAVGQAVKEEQPLVDIMTDKATVEVASPVSGRVLVLKGSEGTKAAVGSELVEFEVEGVETVAAVASAPALPASAPAKTTSIAKPTGKALAAPAVRARAKALGIDLTKVTARDPDGRILHSDLDAILLSKQAAPAAGPLMTAREPGIEDIKVFGLRRRIAERMLEAKRRIPHFAYVEEVDVTALEALRAKLNAARGTRAHLTPLAFLIRAVVSALETHPGVNAQYDDVEGVIRRFKSVHTGVATQTDRGLLVPVIHHAEAKDLWQLASEITRLSAEARSGKANREELMGSTITVTSLGALGGIAATPIINPPEVAVIGVNRIADRPVVRDGAIVIRKMMNLSSSFDHRIIDGFEAAAFIKSVKDGLENPAVIAAGTPLQ